MTPTYLQESGQAGARPAKRSRVRSREPFHALERGIAAIALVLLAPLILAIAITILLLSRQHPLIRHRRVGWQGRTLAMLKFRTMWASSAERGSRFVIEDVGGPVPESKLAGDSRVSSGFAAFCRKHSLDELPQLYHVIRGEMSLVGPRPITRAELEDHYGPAVDEVLSVRPGLTGLWQVMGRSRLSYEQRRRLDLLLVRRGSAGLYLRILRRSIAGVFSGRDAA